jgi:nucleoid-associated protein YgaU
MRSITPYERFGKPTPQADSEMMEYTFTAGDTITHLAHRFHGDWRLWRTIAERNNIIDVRTIEPGAVLLIPALPLPKGSYESI